MDPFPRLRKVNSWPAPASPEEHAATAKAAFDDAYTRAYTDPELLASHVLLIAWRITREIARVRGVINARQDSLSSLTATRWRITDKERGLPTPAPSDNPPDHAATLAYELPLLPASTPQYTYLAEFTAAYLAVPTTGPQRAALNLLLEDPVRFWPDHQTISTYDEYMIEGTSRRLLKSSRPKISRSIQNTYGLLPHEANNLVMAATHAYTYLGAPDPLAEKGLMIAKLEDFAHRMREAMHPREEIHALKTIATIQGLTKPEASSDEEDMTDVIARVSGEPPLPAPAGLESHPSGGYDPVEEDTP